MTDVVVERGTDGRVDIRDNVGIEEGSTVVIEPTPVQAILGAMLDAVDAGLWCRNNMYDPATNRSCTLGFVQRLVLAERGAFPPL